VTWQSWRMNLAIRKNEMETLLWLAGIIGLIFLIGFIMIKILEGEDYFY
jgi:hypothetical protein